jgi:hypothetical protein
VRYWFAVRRTSVAVGLLVLLGAGAQVAGRFAWAHGPGYETGLPLLLAAVIGLYCRSPTWQAERTGARRLAAVRLLHVSVLAAAASAGTVLAGLGRGFDWTAVVTRNLATCTGLALLGAALADPRVSWAVPASACFASVVCAPLLSRPGLLGWSVLPADRGTWSAAVAVLGIGTVALVTRGTQETRREAHEL